MTQLLMIGDCWQVLDQSVHDHQLWLVNEKKMVMRTKYHLTGHRNYCLWSPWWYFEIEFELKSSFNWRVLSDQEYFQLKSCSKLNVFGLENSLSCFKSTWMNEFEKVVKCSFGDTFPLSFKWSQKSQLFCTVKPSLWRGVSLWRERERETVTRVSLWRERKRDYDESKFVKREREGRLFHSLRATLLDHRSDSQTSQFPPVQIVLSSFSFKFFLSLSDSVSSI